MPGLNTMRWILGPKKPKQFRLKCIQKTEASLQIRLRDANGPVLSQVEVPEHTGWRVIEIKLKQYQTGIHNLVVESLSDNEVEIDWISFR